MNAGKAVGNSAHFKAGFDPDIPGLAVEIDRLLNWYNSLKYPGCLKKRIPRLGDEKALEVKIWPPFLHK
ncbi:MAG: hypothetical protein ACM3X9_13715 [Bacillota bacterium]